MSRHTLHVRWLRPTVMEKQSLETVILSAADERANVLTHGLGVLLSIGVTGYFAWVTAERDWMLRLVCMVFSLSLIAVYVMSTLSHWVTDPKRRNRLRAWDQGVIYCLISGTYSPFIWECAGEQLRVILLIAVWAAAAFGFYSKVLAAHRINAVSTATYLALGWLPAIPLVHGTPTFCLRWMVYGGLCYTVGVLFLKLSTRRLFAHAVWHILVMLGSACHFIAINYLVHLEL